MVLKRGLPLLLSVALGACGANVDARVQLYRQRQARDLVAEYEQARARSDLLGMCVKSNLVSGAYLDAKDASDATAWRSRNAEDCRAAHAALGPDAPATGK